MRQTVVKSWQLAAEVAKHILYGPKVTLVYPGQVHTCVLAPQAARADWNLPPPAIHYIT
jgi:hypothetical protein